MKSFLFLIFAAISLTCNAQMATPSAPSFYWSNKDFSKEVALFRAKSFVVANILGTSTKTVKFEMDPLAAASSGELTSLVYKSSELNKEGLILGFFGPKWSPDGVFYQGYGFKDLPTVKAIELLNKIEKVISDNTKYLNAETSTNNVTFTYDDLTFIISFDIATNIRVFWNDFDASWDGTAFKRTKKRLLKKLD